MLANYEANPLNVHGLREMSFCPPHFTKVSMEGSYIFPITVRNWLYQNLEGRFYMHMESGRQSIIFIAFEISGEASYFALMRDQIQNGPYT